MSDPPPPARPAQPPMKGGAGELPAGLRPSSVGEILERGLRLYRDNFALFYSVPLIYLTLYAVPSAFFFPLLAEKFKILADLGADASHSPPSVYFGLALPFLFPGIFFLLAVLVLKPITEGAMVLAASERLAGRPASFRGVFAGALRRGRSLVALQILRSLLYLLSLALGGALAALTAGALRDAIIGLDLSPPATMMLLLLDFLLAVPILTGPFLVLFLCFILSTPVMIVEGVGPRVALERSTRLVRSKAVPGFFHSGEMRATAILTVAGLVQIVLALAAELPFLDMHEISPTAVGALDLVDLLDKIGAVSPSLIAVSTLVSTLVQGLGQPLILLFMYLFYLDVRARAKIT